MASFQLKMRSILALACVCLVVVGCYADEEVTELKVETIVKPEQCSRAASRGDMLEMHYKGSLLSGAEFDSRFDSLRYFFIFSQ